jgi:hypothetical protein
MANSINDLSPDIRDFLLNRNLILSDTVTDNGLSAAAVGLGTSSNISTYPTSVQASENLEISGEEIRNSIISRNRYTSIEDMISACVISNEYSYEQRDGGYITENNELNFGGPSTQPLDTLDSIVSQTGFGLDGGGLLNQGDIRTTLAGRALGNAGLINETPLGIIGGEQLALAFAQRASFNAQRELFGQINLQPFSLLSGSDFIVPDNSITIRSTTGGRIGDVLLDVAGFNLPIDIIDDDASIANPNSLLRNNTLIKYTGKGQLIRLFEGINANKYKPNYLSDGAGRSKLGVVDPKDYGPVLSAMTLTQNVPIPDTFGGGIVPVTTEFDGSDYIWNPYVVISEQDSLLSKTKTLFNDRVQYLVNFDLQGTPSIDFSQLNTPSGDRLSHGSGVLSHAGKKINGVAVEGDKENVFARTWNSTKPYAKVSDLQKNTGLIEYQNKIRNDIEDSVLGDNGFVKISPYNVPEGEEDAYEAKKFMFSIENLAWNDSRGDLPKFEIGNGDPKTGTKGRIMWFPPYDIKFTDTSAVNWDSTNFIGRGEPVYTYNNTERSGTLSFKVIIDYPDYMNNSKITTDELMASLASGSLDYNKYFSDNEEIKITEEINSNIEPTPFIQTITPNTPDRVVFYFENDITAINPSYEATGLNSDWLVPNYAINLSAKLRQNKGIKIKISAFASLSGDADANLVLSDGRIVSVKTWLIDNLDNDIDVSSRFLGSESFGESQSSSTGTVDSEEVKRERSAKVDFIYEPKDDVQVQNVTEIKKEPTNTDNEIIAKIKRRFHREDEYFEKLKKSADDGNIPDGIIYDNIRNKIKFFHPAFHSTTPEGFNSRLTFLQQCTRQGPTDATNKSNNLAFGSPPICILRIGDFYHTKIAINNLAINYDPLVWDLNPEGVGVQPMIANVELAFKFIGGSALNGPINKLQNAVSFNYFANSGVYDPRADRFVRKDGGPDEDGNLFDFLEGVKDFSELNEENPPKAKTETDLGVSNEAETVAETAASTTQEVVDPVVNNDREILLGVDWSLKYYSDRNQIFLQYTSGGSLSGLIGEYNVFLETYSADAIGYIEVIKKELVLTKDQTAGDFTSDEGWDPVEFNNPVEGGSSYRLTISGGDIANIVIHTDIPSNTLVIQTI